MMNNSFEETDYFKNLPLILKDILLSRPDLLDLKYDTFKCQDKFLIWIITKGINQYPNLFDQKGKKYLLKWLSKKIIFKDNLYLPRIVYALWKTNLSQRQRWKFHGLVKK